MRSALSLEREWLEGLHKEYLPEANTFPVEIRDAISYSSRKLANPLFPLAVKWVLEPTGVPQASIIPVAYSIHLLEASSYIVDHLIRSGDSSSDRKLEKLHTTYGDALCILCVDAMVTMAFQLLTELPQDEFLEISNVLVDRFGADGVLGNKSETPGNWKGDMFVVGLEVSSRMARLDPAVKRALMNYAKKTAQLYRKLQCSIGEPPGRELVLGRRAVHRLTGECEQGEVVKILDELLEATSLLGSRYFELFELSEGCSGVFSGLGRSLSRLEKENEPAASDNGVR